MSNGAGLHGKRERYKRFLTLTFFCVVGVYLGLAAGYPRVFTPTRDHNTFSLIGRDGWIEDGATIALPRLFQRGNRVDLRFTGWRPPGQPPAELSFEVCGEEVNRSVITEDTVVRLFLTGLCEPRTITIRALNPFTPGGTDHRQLGAQLQSLTLSSKLGLPVITPELVLLVTGFVLAFVIVALELLPLALRMFGGVVLAGICGWLLSTLHLAPVGKLFTLWVVACAAVFGASLARAVIDERDLPSESEETSALYTFVLFVIVAIAAYFRFSGLSFGLPATYHPDEVAKFNAIMRMYESGSLDPNYFLHPTLLLYATYTMNLLLHGVGVLTGSFGDTLILAGRSVSATAGVLSIVLTYMIGKRLFSVRAGLLAAALLAVFPLHVTCSRYLKEDSLLTFFVLLSSLFTVYAFRSKKSFWLVLSGIAAGCSASVKYSGMMSVGIPFLGALALEGRWFLRDRRVWCALLLALLAVPVAFLLCSPYVVLNATKFLHDFQFEQQHMQNGHLFAITPWSQYWMYHVERSLYQGVMAPPFLLGFVALGFFLRKQKLPGLIVIAVLLAFYFPAEYVKAKPAPQPERYILPCLPFFALLIAGMLQNLFPRGKTFLFASAIALLSPLLRTVSLHSDMVPDTRARMAEWMSQEIPEGSRIYIDHKTYSPRLPRGQYRVTYASSENIADGLELETLSSDGYQYLLLSSLWFDRFFSQPRTDEVVRRKIERILRDGELVHRERAKSGTYGFHNPELLLFRLPEPEAQ